MSAYNPQEIEKKWQLFWAKNKTFKSKDPATDGRGLPKYFVLDMFPYPSGAGLHVGHPLGYIATDIVARYKRLKGYNVLHPMGYDSFGLPAEQYAIQTGQHPEITTKENINRYRQQLDNLGFSYDWDKEVKTSDPNYYKWTQWIFIQLFNSWYDKNLDKARPISELVEIFGKEGNLGGRNISTSASTQAEGLRAVCDEATPLFTAEDWNNYSENEKHAITLKFRLAYLANTFVNWCPGLGTVLANEEVKDGVSERGGFPVLRKEMPQWQLRITAYAERLINDLDLVQWPEAIKEQQRNWIGKSRGCMVSFKIHFTSFNPHHQQGDGLLAIEVFTTRVDTLFGVTYLTLAPEHELIAQLTTESKKEEVKKYVDYAKNRSERDRQADVKTISGAFTGAYATNPFSNEKIPIWIGEYVLAGYGTGAVMAVPSSDTRDYNFAKHFNLPIIQVQEGAHTDISLADFDPKAGTMINSEFLNGMAVKEAIDAAIYKVEEMGVGYGKVNYRIRDSIFSRQRYWGEPIPIYYKDGLPYALPESHLPLVLPEVDKFLPTEDGEPPLARAVEWEHKLRPQPNSVGQGSYLLETNTMPGWAGSSWYFFRYMDNNNNEAFASKEALNYWQDVDLYLGGSEHATGHLLYSRFWTKFLFDLGYVNAREYAKKLINQGMIQGRSNFVYRITTASSEGVGARFVSHSLKNQYETTAIHVDVNMVENDILDIEKFKSSREEYKNAEFILESKSGMGFPTTWERESGGEVIPVYICGFEVEKMSKSKLNVVNPDDVVEKYGADTLRLYEMFLGPLEMSKPWNTNSISGVSRFLRNVWKLFFDENDNWLVTDQLPTDKELKVLHKTIKKVEEDIERFSFNTSVSSFMVCVNELSELKCHKKTILKEFLTVLSPYAPHIAEELWEITDKKFGLNSTSPSSSAKLEPNGIASVRFPQWDQKYLMESSFEYPISINGRVRHKMLFPLDATHQTVESEAIATPEIQKWLEGKVPKKVIVVTGKIINIVL